MELLRFIKWQWNRFSYDEVAFGLDCIITCAVVAYLWYSVGFFTAFWSGIGVFFGIALISVIEYNIRKQWRVYKDQREKEARRIMDKLRGSSR